jgi:hypothetical protein
MVNPFTPIVSDAGDSVVKPTAGPATNPFVLDPARIQANAIESSSKADQLYAETPAYVASKVEAAKKAEQQSQARLGTITEVTNVFSSNLAKINSDQQEVDAARLAIMDRADKRDKLNPIIRPFIELIHPSLSAGAIQEDAIRVDMRSRIVSDQFLHENQNYASQLTANKTLWTAEDAATAAEQGVSDAVFNGMMTTVQMADQNFTRSAQAFNGIVDARKGERQLAMLALSGLTDAQVSAAEQQARAKGQDFFEINGARVPLGMIEETRQQDQQAAMSRKAQALAIASGEMGLANQLQEKSIREMSMPALIAAVKAGGNGLPMTALQLELTNRGRTQDSSQEYISAAESGAVRTASALARSGYLASQMIRNYGFMNGTGQITNVQTQTAISSFATMQARNLATIQEAKRNGTFTPGLEQKLLADTANAQQMLFATITNDIRMQGGTKEMIAAKQAFLVNGQLDPATAGQVLTQGIMGGQNADQLHLRGSAAAAYAAGQEKFFQLVAPKIGWTPEAMKGKTREQIAAEFQRQVGSGKIKREEIERQVIVATREAYSVSAAQRLHLNIPELLKQSGYDTGVPNSAWQESIHAGEAMVEKQLMERYGLRKAGAQHVLANGENSPYYSKDMAAAGITADSLAGAGAAATFQYLDANYSDGKHIPSAAIAAGLQNPKFGQLAGNLQPALANRDFGNFMINSVVGDNIASNVDGMQQVYIKAAAKRNADIKGSWNRGAGLYGNNPQTRFEAIVHNVPDLTDSEVKELLAAARQHLPADQVAAGILATAPKGLMGGLPAQNARRDYTNALDDLGRMKFENQRLEALRKKTVAALPKATQTTDRVMAIRGSVNPVILGETE